MKNMVGYFITTVVSLIPFVVLSTLVVFSVWNKYYKEKWWGIGLIFGALVLFFPSVLLGGIENFFYPSLFFKEQVWAGGSPSLMLGLSIILGLCTLLLGAFSFYHFFKTKKRVLGSLLVLAVLIFSAANLALMFFSLLPPT